MALLCYISSTFSDLEHERKLVFYWLAKQDSLYKPVNSEAQSPHPVLKTCFDDIQRCDIYILLLGARYGTRSDSQYGDNLSYTHHEFRHAKKLGKQCYAFQMEASEAWADISNSDNDCRKDFWKEVGSYKKVAADKLIDELSTSLNKYAYGSFEEGISGLVPRPPLNESAQVAPTSMVNSLEAVPEIQAALMIKLQETGGSEMDEILFEFDADLFTESSTPGRGPELPWALHYQELRLDIGPKENKLFRDLGPYIAKCWENAEAKLNKLKVAGIIPTYKLHVEIFACRIAVDKDFGHLDVSIQPSGNGSFSQRRPTRNKSLLSMPYLLRSLDRLRADFSETNNLENQWLSIKQPVSQAIATCKCPYVEGQDEASNPRDRLESFYTRLESYPAHFHLPALPRDKDNKDEFFDEIVWSGIPIALWWANIRATSIQILLQRSKLLFEQLAGEGLPNQLKAEIREDSNINNKATKNETVKETEEETEEETVLIDLKLSNLMMHDLALRRRDLFTREPGWIPDLVLLIDCPGRYPKKFQVQEPYFSQS
jgi:hypothetical protein